MSLVESQPPPRRPSSPVSKSRGQAGRPSRLVSVSSPSGVDSSFPPNLSLPAPLHRAQPPHPGRADICSILRIPATPAVCCAVRKPRSIFHPRGQGSYTKPAQGDQHCGGAAGMRPAKPWPQPRGSAGQTEHTSQKKMRARHVCQPLPGQSHWLHTSESPHQASEEASLGALPPPRTPHTWFIVPTPLAHSHLVWLITSAMAVKCCLRASIFITKISMGLKSRKIGT